MVATRVLTMLALVMSHHDAGGQTAGGDDEVEVESDDVCDSGGNGPRRASIPVATVGAVRVSTSAEDHESPVVPNPCLVQSK
jgi:hypothetical protein